MRARVDSTVKTESNQKMARVVREEINSRVQTLNNLQREMDAMESDTVEDEVISWIDERIEREKDAILELVHQYNDVSDDTISLLLTVMQSKDWQWVLEEMDHIQPDGRETIDAVKTLDSIEKEHNLSTKEASQLLQNLIESTVVLEGESGSWLAISEFELSK